MEGKREEEPRTGRPPPPTIDGYRNRFLPVASWAMYDFANTIYSGIVVTFFFTLYIAYELQLPKTVVALATTLSMIFSGLLVPFLGSIPDRTGKTKMYLLIATMICVVCTAALSGPTLPLLLLSFYFVANVAYQVAMVFYNALLPTVATPDRQGTVSGWGVALGYIGVILALFVAGQFILYHEKGDPQNQVRSWDLSGVNPENSDRGLLYASFTRRDAVDGPVYGLDLFKGPERREDQRVAEGSTEAGASLPQEVGIESLVEENPVTGSVKLEAFTADNASIEVRITRRWVFLTAAVLFAIFSVPLAVFVRERKVARPEPLGFRVAYQGFRMVFKNLRSLPSNRPFLFFLIGNFMCVDVLNTAIQWFSFYFKEVFSFSYGDIIYLGIGMAGSAFIAGIVMGKLTDKLGSRPTMLGAAILLVLCVAIVGLAPVAFVAVISIVTVGALGLAGLWVAGRKWLIELAPPDRIGEYFGLYGITVKISVFGTLIFAVLADHLSEIGHFNHRFAILVQLVIIIPGIIFLWLVRTPKNRIEPAPEN